MHRHRRDEDELRVNLAGLPRAGVADLDDPAAVGLLRQVGHLVTEEHGATGGGDVVDELLGERTEVDVRAGRGPVDGDRVGEVTTLRHQRQTLGEQLGGALGVLHAREQRVAGQRVVPGAQVLHVVGAVHEADVRNRVDEVLGIGQDPVVDGVGPELARDLELLVDVDRLGDVDGAVGLGRGGVVQLAQRGVTGSGVVPGIAALRRGGVEPLESGDRPVGLQLTQQRAEGGAHDACTDEHYIGLRL